MVVLVVVLALLVAAAVAAIVAFNRLTRARQAVREAWAQIDVMLARRHRLVTDLAAVAAGNAAFERATTASLVAARDDAAGTAGAAERGAAEERLDHRVADVVARAEALPDLGADGAFRKLRLELVAAEEDVSAARRYYNGRVRLYHDTTGSFPTNLLAGPFGFGPAEYFQADREEREVPHAG
jgi:LemA protein